MNISINDEDKYICIYNKDAKLTRLINRETNYDSTHKYDERGNEIYVKNNYMTQIKEFDDENNCIYINTDGKEYFPLGEEVYQSYKSKA